MSSRFRTCAVACTVLGIVVAGPMHLRADVISPTPVSSIDILNWSLTAPVTKENPHPQNLELTNSTFSFVPTNSADPGPFTNALSPETVDLTQWFTNSPPTNAVTLINSLLETSTLVINLGEEEGTATFSIGTATLFQGPNMTGRIDASLTLMSSSLVNYDLSAMQSARLRLSYTGLLVLGEADGVVETIDENASASGSISPVPEPGTMALLGSGTVCLAGFGWWSRRRPRLHC